MSLDECIGHYGVSGTYTRTYSYLFCCPSIPPLPAK